MDNILLEISKQMKFVFIPFKDFHKQDRNGFVQLLDGSRCFQFRDDDHFSNCGERYVSENIEDWQTKYLRKNRVK